VVRQRQSGPSSELALEASSFNTSSLTPHILSILFHKTDCTTAAMDTDMTDAGYDIDIDVGAGLSVPAQQPTLVIEVNQAQGCS
jgi:hypothetical protein